MVTEVGATLHLKLRIEYVLYDPESYLFSHSACDGGCVKRRAVERCISTKESSQLCRDALLLRLPRPNADRDIQFNATSGVVKSAAPGQASKIKSKERGCSPRQKKAFIHNRRESNGTFLKV